MPVKLISKGFGVKPTPKEQIIEMVKEFMNKIHQTSTQRLRHDFPDRVFPDGSLISEAKSAWV